MLCLSTDKLTMTTFRKLQVYVRPLSVTWLNLSISPVFLPDWIRASVLFCHRSRYLRWRPWQWRCAPGARMIWIHQHPGCPDGFPSNPDALTEIPASTRDVSSLRVKNMEEIFLTRNRTFWDCIGESKGAPGTRCPLWIQFLSFSCSFWERFGQIIGWPWGLPPSIRKSWIRHCLADNNHFAKKAARCKRKKLTFCFNKRFSSLSFSTSSSRAFWRLCSFRFRNPVR